MLLTAVGVILASLAVFLLYGVASYVKDKILYSRLPRGPIPIPFIGSVYRLDPKRKPWQVFKELSEEYGSAFTLYFGKLRLVYIHGTKTTRNAFVLRAKNFSDRIDSFTPGYIGHFPQGIASAEGHKWITNRKFGVVGLKMFGLGQAGMLVKIQNEACNLVDTLNERCREGKVQKDLADMIQNNVFNVICCLTIGRRLELDDPKFEAIRQSSQIFFERPFRENFVHCAFPFLTWFSPPPQVQDISAVSKTVIPLLEEEVNERRKLPEKQEPEDFVDLFIKRQKDISFDTFVGITRDMFLAGTETTSSLLTWAIIYLCKWPKYQEKCQEVIDQVITSDRMPTMGDRENLVYIDAFMNELQRHVTLVPNALYHGVIGSDIEFEGYTIPANTGVIYNIWDHHYNAEYWGDPEVFKPARWIGDDGKLLDHSSNYMPFGTGPRICLGEGLAKVEYYVFIVAMLQRFTFKFPKDYDVDLDSGRFSITNVPPPFDCIITERQSISS